LYVNYLSEDPRINLKSVYDLADPGSPVFTRFFTISRFDKYHILEAQNPPENHTVEFVVEHSCDSENVNANLRIIDLANMRYDMCIQGSMKHSVYVTKRDSGENP